MSARLLLALPAVALLAACTSSGKSAPSSSAPVPQGMPTTTAKLSALVTSAAAGISSAHLQMGLNLSAEQLTGTGDEKLAGGDLAALDLTARLAGAGDIDVVYIDDKTYARLPASMNPSGKPYLLVTPDSSNATIQQLAPYLGAAVTAVSPGQLGLAAAAAPTADVKGTQTVDGTETTRYALQVEVAKLPSAIKDQLPAGSRSLPLDLYVTSNGRLAKADLGLTVQGENVPIDVEFSDFNQPVTITSPPAGQVGS